VSIHISSLNANRNKAKDTITPTSHLLLLTVHLLIVDKFMLRWL